MDRLEGSVTAVLTTVSAVEIPEWLIHHRKMLERICLFFVLFLVTVGHAAEPRARVLWEFALPGPQFNCFNVATINHSNETIYIGDQEGSLRALTLKGKVRWSWKGRGGIHTKPAIAPDGTIYVGHFNGGFSAISKEGHEKWTIPLGLSERSSPILAPDGTIYFHAAHTEDNRYRSYIGALCAASPDGKILWSHKTGYGGERAPKMAPDGTILIRGSNESSGTGRTRVDLYSIRAGEKIDWAFEDVSSDPAIGPDGSIYVTTYQNSLTGLDSFGRMLWQTDLLAPVWIAPFLDSKGNVLAGTSDGYVYSVNPQGKVNWIFETSGDVMFCGNMSPETEKELKLRTRKFHPGIQFSPVTDKTGNVIFAGGNNIYSLNNSGRLNWSLDLGERVNTAPVVDGKGTVYVGVNSSSGKPSRFVAIKSPVKSLQLPMKRGT